MDETTEAPALDGMTPDDAKDEIERTCRAAGADQSHPYFDARHPDHKATSERMEQLYRLAFPEDGSEGAPPAPGVEPQTIQEKIDAAMAPPARAEDYQLDKVNVPAAEIGEDLGDGFSEDLAEGKAMAAGIAHQLGLPQGDVDALVPRFNELMADETRHDPDVIAARQDDCRAVLHDLWGPDMERNFAMADDEAGRHGEGLKNFLKNSRLGDDPWMIRTLYEAARRRTEGFGS